MEAIEYKGYTIQSALSPFGGFDYFPTAQGMDEDNVKRADTIEDAKDEISEKIMTELPAWKVETFNPLNGGSIITEFWHIVDAVVFASKRNGNLLNIESI